MTSSNSEGLVVATYSRKKHRPDSASSSSPSLLSSSVSLSRSISTEPDCSRDEPFLSCSSGSSAALGGACDNTVVVAATAVEDAGKKRRRWQQLFLDFGQKDFGSSACKSCGMVYYPGKETDEQVHRLFHRQALSEPSRRPPIRFQGWQDERVVKQFVADGARVVKILPSDPPSHRRKLASIFSLVDHDLCYIATSGGKEANNQVTFLYIDGKQQVVGCAVAEFIQQAYLSLAPSEAKLPTVAPLSSVVVQGQPTVTRRRNLLEFFDCPAIVTAVKDSPTKAEQSVETPCQQQRSSSCASSDGFVCCGTVPQAAVCGINRIWVHAGERRKGIATRLMDTVRANFLYGTVVPKEQCAFSQPTSIGRKFIVSYLASEKFLVYRTDIFKDAAIDNGSSDDAVSATAALAFE